MKKSTSFLRLLAFEWKKNFLSPWMLLFLVVLLAANGWKLTGEYQRSNSEFADYEAVYEEFYAHWKGTITTENVRELMDIYGPLAERAESMCLNFSDGSGTYTSSEFEDYRFFYMQFANEMENDYLYVNQAIAIARKARELGELYESRGITWKAAESRAFAKIFQNRKISQFADTRYIQTWLNHDYSSMLVLLLCLFGLCTVFVTERETEMYMLQRTSRLGGGVTVAAKLTASALFTVLVCVLFYGEDFLVLQEISGHWEALSSPVYAIRNLEATPLNMTIGQFVLWSGGVKMLGMLSCGCLILLCSCLCRRVLTTFVAGFGTIMALVVLQEFCRTRYALKWLNPMELVLVREIVTDAAFVNLFGHPVPLHDFVIFGVLTVMVATVIAILCCNPGRMERRGKP